MITYRQGGTLVDAFRAFQVIQHLDNFYPDFTDWYTNKVIPQLLTGDGRLVLAEDDGDIVGIALGRGGSDPKLQCVRVVEPYKNRGVAVRLIDRTLPLLGSDRPPVSVAEEVFDDLSRILVNYFDFKLDHVAKGLYRPGTLEYFFNVGRDDIRAALKRKTAYGS